MKTTETPGACWSCGKIFELSSDLTGTAVPKAGDVSICIECAAFGVYEKDLAIRPPTGLERAQILADPRAVRLMLAVRLMHEAKP